MLRQMKSVLCGRFAVTNKIANNLPFSPYRQQKTSIIVDFHGAALMFVVTGFVGNNAEIRQFTNTSVARFSLAVSRQEKNGEETNRVSAFMNMEAWRKNEHVESFNKLQKGTMLTVEGYFKPDEWVDQQGTKHNRIVFIANKFYPTPDKEDAPDAEPEKSAKKEKK